MREDKLAERSMEFAVQIIELTKTLRMRKEFIMANQIGRSGTSIGANIREVHYAQSRDDFVSKLEIALKEANETDYWLELLFRTGYLPDQQFRQLRAQRSASLSSRIGTPFLYPAGHIISGAAGTSLRIQCAHHSAARRINGAMALASPCLTIE